MMTIAGLCLLLLCALLFLLGVEIGKRVPVSAEGNAPVVVMPAAIPLPAAPTELPAAPVTAKP